MDHTYEELVHSLWHLVFGTRYGHYITGHLCAGKIDFAIPFLFELFNCAHASNQFSMVQAVDDDGFGDEFRVLEWYTRCVRSRSQAC